MKVRAQAKYIRQSPYKVRRILDLVRGLSVGEAELVLRHTPHRAAEPIVKTLKSAVANAEHNEGADIDELKVAEVFVNEGMTMKRIKPRAKGRADRIFKRSSHVTVTVTDE